MIEPRPEWTALASAAFSIELGYRSFAYILSSCAFCSLLNLTSFDLGLVVPSSPDLSRERVTDCEEDC